MVCSLEAARRAAQVLPAAAHRAAQVQLAERGPPQALLPLVFACLTHLPVRSLFVARCSLKAAHRATQAQVEAKGLPRVLDLHQPVLSKGQVGGLGEWDRLRRWGWGLDWARARVAWQGGAERERIRAV